MVKETVCAALARSADTNERCSSRNYFGILGGFLRFFRDKFCACTPADIKMASSKTDTGRLTPIFPHPHFYPNAACRAPEKGDLAGCIGL